VRHFRDEADISAAGYDKKRDIRITGASRCETSTTSIINQVSKSRDASRRTKRTKASIASDNEVYNMERVMRLPDPGKRSVTDFSFGGQTFNDVQDDFDAIDEAMDQTAWILKQLCESKHNATRHYLQAAPDRVVRLWQPKTWYVKSDKVIAGANVETPEQSLGMAYYLFADTIDITECAQCKNKKSRGPGTECVHVGKTGMLGACTNCYGTKQGQRCSIRKELAEREKAVAAMAKGHFVAFTPEMLSKTTTSKLKEWQAMFREELERRIEEQDEMSPKSSFRNFSAIMPRGYNINIDEHRDALIEQYLDAEPVSDILRWLNDTHAIRIGKTAFYKRLKIWGITPKHGKTIDTHSMREALLKYYFEEAQTDEQLVETLRNEGHSVTRRGVVTIRKSLDIYRRMDYDQIAGRRQELIEFFNHAGRSTILLPRLSRRNLYDHIHQQARINLATLPMFQTFREFYADEIRERQEKVLRRRGGWTVPGPNYIWSIDGYCKLRAYGFEIYAAIDAYARFITWFYCGISALTEKSIAAQYINVVGQHGFIPMVIRSDRADETMIAGTMHYWLAKGAKDNRPPKPRRNNEGELEFIIPGEDGKRVKLSLKDLDPNAPLYHESGSTLAPRDVWCYGKSTANQRIESWWNQLAKSRASFWNVSQA
ncbi:hypothetical protein SCUP515_13347, partial [Seiridium cupressi]